MGSILNFVFENDCNTHNGSPRYSYQGPLWNYVMGNLHFKKQQNFTENLKINSNKKNLLFYEIQRGELEFKRILKKHKNWIIENNVNIILANIADPTSEHSHLHLRKIVEQSPLKNYIHFIDTNIILKKYYKVQTFDYFIEEIIGYKDKIENELFGYGNDDKNDLGYLSEKIQENELDRTRNKKFLSFNRIITTKYHRSKFFFDSFKFNLHNDSYFSFLQTDLLDNKNDYFSEIKTEYRMQEMCISKLPITLDTDNYKGHYNMFRTHNTFKKELFLDSCINLVTETSFQYNELFLSEKILKPIVMYQPFIVFGGAYYLTHLKELGFQTFDEFWDESYDKIEDYEKRYNKILLLILELNNKPIEELNNLYKNLKHICIYNRNHLMKLKKNSWPQIMGNISNSFYKNTTENKTKELI